MKTKFFCRLKFLSTNLFILIFLFSSFLAKGSILEKDIVSVNDQQHVVSGLVQDEMGSPLPGVSIIIKGTSKGTTTDFDGNYSIVAPADAVLEFSYLGYAIKKIPVAGKTLINVILIEDVSALDEVVVVGYGTQKKVNLTGAVETITFKDEVNKPVTNSAQLLYGQFSGVQLTQTSGNAGADGSSIVIRGIGTFGNSTPLVVIDNMQYTSLSAFNNLAPSDIKSITVLKDASASAIYGARGANGVIVITTKKGKKDHFEINYNQYYGSQTATVIPEFLGSLDYATLINEKFRNQGGTDFIPRYDEDQMEAIRTGSLPDQFADTNWTDEVLRSAPIQNHHLSFSGGSDKTTYRLSLGYLGQESIVTSKFETKRYNLGINISSDLKDWFKISSVTNSYWSNDIGPTGGQDVFYGDNGIIYSFQRTSPTIPTYYSNGEFGIVDGAYEDVNFSFQTQNPLRQGFLGNYEKDRINISQRIGLLFKFTENLSFETSGSGNLIYNQTSDFNPTAYENDWEGNAVIISPLNRLKNTTYFSYNMLNENVLRYNKTINENHTIGTLLGHSVSYYKYDDFGGLLSGFPTDNIEEFNGGGVVDPSVFGGASEEAYQSFFGRVTYSFKEKYLTEFNLRRDGSSKFASNNKYGYFPSASVGWRISKEDFLSDVDFISNLKLRGSWGISGNDRIGNYIFEQTYNPNIDYVLGDDTTVVGVAFSSLANPSIKWEETEQYDIGLDLSMFRNRLEITADYFNRKSADILYKNFPIPATIGVTNLAAQNAASMVNEGLELSIKHRANAKGIRYSVGANITKFLNNEVTGLGDGGEETIGSYNIIRIGDPFKAYYGYKAIGVFQSIDEVLNSPVQFGNTNTGPGDLKYADINGIDENGELTGIPDGVVDANDRTIIGNPHPELLINFNGSLEYKSVDVNFLFQGVNGVDRLLMGNGNLPINDNRSNVLTYWIDRWTYDNPSTNLPRVGGQNNSIVSSFYIQDASYLRLKNIELGYSLPQRIADIMKLTKLRIFVSGQNLITFTGLEHFDPEGANGNISNRGVPLYKTFTTGINIKF